MVILPFRTYSRVPEVLEGPAVGLDVTADEDVEAVGVDFDAGADAVGVVAEDGPPEAQMMMCEMDLSPVRPPGSETPFRLPSANTAVPGAGRLKTVFTWKLGSSEVSDPALTMTLVYVHDPLGVPGGNWIGLGRV